MKMINLCNIFPFLDNPYHYNLFFLVLVKSQTEICVYLYKNKTKEKTMLVFQWGKKLRSKSYYAIFFLVYKINETAKYLLNV